MLLYKIKNMNFLTQGNAFTFISDGKSSRFAVLTPLQVKVPKCEVQHGSCWYFQAPHALRVVGVCAGVVPGGHGATHGTQDCVSAPITYSENNSLN